ncbi:MAG: hypothetical protein WBD99_02080 [Thermodesulfobacteriota bacterium]
MKRVREVSTLKTDMLFLLIAVSYILLTAASFKKEGKASVPDSGRKIEDVERVSIFISPHGIFEITREGTIGGAIDLEKLINAKENAGVEIYPSDDVTWRDVRLVYFYLSRRAIDVVVKPYYGGMKR